MIKSKLCTISDYEDRDYRDALVDLNEGFIFHRKQWEFVMILRALKERGFLNPNTSGLGFAVGTEPLPSAFCVKGSRILATDQAPSEEANKEWGDGQLCPDLETLNARGLCDPDKFKELCSFRHVDMNFLPDDIGEFDFLWSSCAFEHLGDLERGMRFVLDSTKYLKSGGLAVHTTEFNLTSNVHTVSSGPSVYYRKKDIEELERRLAEIGCRLEPPNFSPGDNPADALVDVERKGPPHFHLKLQIDEYTLTSIVLVIQKL